MGILLVPNDLPFKILTLLYIQGLQNNLAGFSSIEISKKRNVVPHDPIPTPKNPVKLYSTLKRASYWCLLEVNNNSSSEQL